MATKSQAKGAQQASPIPEHFTLAPPVKGMKQLQGDDPRVLFHALKTLAEMGILLGSEASTKSIEALAGKAVVASRKLLKLAEAVARAQVEGTPHARGQLTKARREAKEAAVYLYGERYVR